MSIKVGQSVQMVDTGDRASSATGEGLTVCRQEAQMSTPVALLTGLPGREARERAGCADDRARIMAAGPAEWYTRLGRWIRGDVDQPRQPGMGANGGNPPKAPRPPGSGQFPLPPEDHEAILTLMRSWGPDAFGGFELEWLCNALAVVANRPVLNHAVRTFEVSRSLKWRLVELIRSGPSDSMTIESAIRSDPSLGGSRLHEMKEAIAQAEQRFLSTRLGKASIQTDRHLVRAMILAASAEIPTVANTIFHALEVVKDPDLLIEANRLLELSLFLRKHHSSIREWDGMSEEARLEFMKRYPKKIFS